MVRVMRSEKDVRLIRSVELERLDAMVCLENRMRQRIVVETLDLVLDD